MAALASATHSFGSSLSLAGDPLPAWPELAGELVPACPELLGELVEGIEGVDVATLTARTIIALSPLSDRATDLSFTSRTTFPNLGFSHS